MRNFLLDSRKAAASVIVVALVFLASAPASAASYQLTILTADQPGVAPNTDPNLINPWGMSFSPTGPFWAADKGTGVSTLYDGNGVPQGLVVKIPPAQGTGRGRPTGTVFNGSSDFVVTRNGKSGPASFLFCTSDGTVSGWNATVNPTRAILAFSNGGTYFGMEIANNGTGNFLYALDFFAAKVVVLDRTFTPVTLAGNFTDPNLPSGWAPYNIRNINGQLFIAYAKQNAAKKDSVHGPGLGIVDIFDLNGNFIKRFAFRGKLNAPWGLAQAPATFGTFANDILVGNLGDGKITAYDATTGALKGQLSDSTGTPLVIPGLWEITFGNGGLGGSADILYFAAGPSAYKHGWFGTITFQ
jgi:uncharacterized protein (TIGR03118 family)